jgi:hypothetical protein
MIIKMDKECIVNNFTSAIEYHEKKVGEGVAKIISGSGYLGANAAEKAKDFDYIFSLNTRLKLKGFDIPFSFDRTDKLTDEKMLAIVSDFKRDMSFENRPFLLYKHEDTDNLHYHLIVSNADWEGKANDNMRGFYRREATLLARQYEVRYGLKELGEVQQTKKFPSQKETNSEKYTIQKAIIRGQREGKITMLISDDIIEKPLTNSQIKIVLGNKYTPLLVQLYKLDLLKKNKKTLLIEKIDSVLKGTNDHQMSIQSYYSLLKKEGVYVREMQKTSPKRITYGLEIEGKMFYCSSKSLPDRFSYAHLMDGPQTNYSLKQQKSYLRNQISKARLNSTNYNSFKENLKKFQIEVHEISNSKFGIYALKYSSKTADYKILFSASELNRDFSYAKLNQHFDSSKTQLQNTIKESFDIKRNIDTSGKGISEPSGDKPMKGVSEDGPTKKAKTGDDFDKKKGRGRG